eukprot:2837777-Alexandrium_andersonii.AAC.1
MGRPAVAYVARPWWARGPPPALCLSACLRSPGSGSTGKRGACPAPCRSSVRLLKRWHMATSRARALRP